MSLTVFAIDCSSRLAMEKICLSVMGDGTLTIRLIIFLIFFRRCSNIILVFLKNSSLFCRNLLSHVR